MQSPNPDSRRYAAKAESVRRMAGRAATPAEKQVYIEIAEGWRRLAAEAARNELRDAIAQAPLENRSFAPKRHG